MNKKGFSLIELLVVIAIFVIVIGIPYKLFIQELKTTVREVSLSQTSIEQVPSLEIMRKDIETAGYGLPWDTAGITYTEAKSASLAFYSLDPASFNSNPPKAITGIKDTSAHGFSYLVLKGTAFGLNKASNHWSYIDNGSKLNIWPTGNSANYNNFQSGDRVIIMDAGNRVIRIGDSSNTFYSEISKNADTSDTDPTNYGLPSLPQSTYLIYGLNNPDNKTSSETAPFNRVDYRLYKGSDNESECATGTHILGRSVMGQGSGFMQSYPILHCVADFQVGFGLDTNNDGSINTWTQDLTNFNADDIRTKLKQVRVYILMQNGTKDKNYSYPHNSIYVGDNSIGIGRDFALSTQISDYQHYRWKVVKLIVTPKNLE